MGDELDPREDEVTLDETEDVVTPESEDETPEDVTSEGAIPEEDE